MRRWLALVGLLLGFFIAFAFCLLKHGYQETLKMMEEE